MKKLLCFKELSKPGIVSLVLVTYTIGFFMASGGFQPFDDFLLGFLGSLLLCAGINTLNQYSERKSDKLMERTKNRPIPSGNIRPVEALLFGVLISIMGLFCFFIIHPDMALGGFITAALYLAVYTPLKKIHWINTLAGAVPGALPPVGGWFAAQKVMPAGAWVLFALMFLWQLPHFYAIAWMYKNDYQKAGFKMLTSEKNGASKTVLQTMIFTVLLTAVSLLPWILNISGIIYAAAACVLGLWFIGKTYLWMRQIDREHARSVLLTSIFYIQILFVFIFIDQQLKF